MSKIEINNVYKIFGGNPKSVLPQVKEGATKDERYRITGRYRDIATLEDNARTQMYLPTHKIGHYGSGIKR